MCVFYLNQVERTCRQIEFTSSDRGSEYFDMLICEVEYFHSLYCNKLLLNNKYLYSAFHHFDRHSSEFYSSRTIYIGLKLWFTNEIIWFLIILLIDYFKVFHDFCLPQCNVIFLHVPSICNLQIIFFRNLQGSLS